MKMSKKKFSSGENNSSFEKRKKPNLKIRSAKKCVKDKITKDKPAKQNKNLTTMSLDDFMSGDLLDSDDSDSENDEPNPRPSEPISIVSNGKNPIPEKKRIKGSAFINDEVEEDEVELEDDDSFINDESEDSKGEESKVVNVNSFFDDEAPENNTFDFGADDAEEEEDDGKNRDSHSEEDDDENNESDKYEGDGTVDKDYADVPGQEDQDGKGNEDDLKPSAHKKSLQRLRATDPEFYKYLEENDKKLLQFQESDSEDDGRDTDKFHKPSEDLEVASDESDFEVEETEAARGKDGVITLKMVREWQEELQTSKKVEAIARAVQGFHAALNRVTGAEEESQYKVDGSSVFNAVVQMCVLELQPAIKRFLRMPTGASADKIQPQKCKKWKKVKSHLRSYLQDLLKLMGGVSSPHVVAVLLKHLHQMAPFVSCFHKLIPKVLKRLINIWASGEETTRVVAFLCVVRLSTSQRSLLDTIFKQMYLAYVSNAKFVSPNTLPGINFMRRSLVEVYRLDEVASYQHVFLYIRQLAIHLRSAMTLQTKESMQAVLNWQFVHSLHMWTELLGATANKPTLQPLLYPLVQVIIGTIKLIPTTQYYPLRFHCVQMLIDLSRNTNTFIPALPFVLEVLSAHDFNRKYKTASMKPMDMTCLLRVSKTEQTDKSFKDATVEQIYHLMLQCLAIEAHSIAFPDLVVAPVLQIKKFLKECKVANYGKKIKSILDKIEENARFVEKERKTVTLNLQDRKAVDAFETNLKLKGTPLATFCTSFQKVNTQVMKKKATDNDKLGDFNLPALMKHKRKAPQDDGPAVPFPSDSEAEQDVDFGLTKPEKKKKMKKVKKTKSKPQSEPREGDDQPDIVQDLKLEDF